MKLLQGAEGDNLFDYYLQFRSSTESPAVYHRWSLAAAIGALLRRNTWLQQGALTVYPSMYIQLIGEPGARKSTAIKFVRKHMRDTGYTEIAASKTSKEKFLMDLQGAHQDDQDYTENPDKALDRVLGLDEFEDRCYSIMADEFVDFVGSGNMEFLSLLGVLWDCPEEYSFRLKNSKSLDIKNPTVTLLSGNTFTSFAEALPPESGGQGFLSRLLLIYGESKKKIAFPEPPDEEDEMIITEALKHMVLRCQGPLNLSPEVKKKLEEIYAKWEPLHDSRLSTYSSRRFTHLLRLLIVVTAARMAVSDVNTPYEVIIEDVMYANSMLTYAENFMPTALGQYGKAQNWKVIQRMLMWVEEETKGGKPVTSSMFKKQFVKDFRNVKELWDAIVGLVESQKLHHLEFTDEKSGEKKQGWLPVKKQIRNSCEGLYDFNLLWEVRRGAASANIGD